MKVYKKALVTGGAQRIGASIAFYLAKMGIDVAIQYNSSEKEMNNIKKKDGLSHDQFQHAQLSPPIGPKIHFQSASQ